MRADIQSLRGYAILIVVLFHAGLSYFPGGYLGVDIFFVISGFLITNLITKQIKEKTFSFREFYFRRAKRLLPAAYVTFVLSAVAALFLLTSQELIEFSQQLIGAVTFTANMVLWRQGTYFGVESSLKPLLHVWSLSIEEQYYFLLPAVLVVIPSRYWQRAMLFACLLSLLVCVAFYYIQAGAAFYLFPARAWELCIGSLGAGIYKKNAVIKLSRILLLPAIATIVCLTLKPFGGMHPGIDSLSVCLGTLIIILSDFQRAFSNFPARILGWFGDISYSLYLVHWPLFAFVYNTWLDEVKAPLILRLLCIGVSICVAYLQYKFVEYPIHKASFKFSKRLTIVGAAVSVAVMAISLLLRNYDAKLNAEYIYARRGNTGLGPACAFKKNFSVLPECETTDNPDILMWGDSYTMHLIPGVDATKGDHSIIQATKYVCGPLMGVAPIGAFVGSEHTAHWAQTCLEFNNSVLNYLEKNKSIKTVVLSSVFIQYLSVDKFDLLTMNNEVVDKDFLSHRDAAKNAIKNTIDKIRSLGKKVVIVAPPPDLGLDEGRCVERLERNMLRFGGLSDCVFMRRNSDKKMAPVYNFLADVSTLNNVSVIKFDDYLDVNGKIIPSIDNQNIFIANGHLSYSGSVYLAKKMDLVNRIFQLAR